MENQFAANPFQGLTLVQLGGPKQELIKSLGGRPIKTI